MGSMLLEIFPVSPRGFESFTRRFGSPFGAIFKREGAGGELHVILFKKKKRNNKNNFWRKYNLK